MRISFNWYAVSLLRKLFLLLLIGTGPGSIAQESELPVSYARKIVDTLSSPSMHGRGYYKNGDKLAASYIGTQFSSLRIDWRYQDVPVSVVSFPKKISCKINGKELTAGSQFIADAGTKSVKGTFRVVTVDSTAALSLAAIKQFLARDFDGKALLVIHENIRNKEIKDRLLGVVRIAKASLLIFADEKLTHSIAQEAEPIAAIHVQSGALPEKIETITVSIRSKVLRNYPVRNVIGKIEGKVKDTFLVYSAHYDHLGRMGPDIFFPGANDNASGVAMILSLARYYAGNPPHYSMLFIAFGGEEMGLVGSRYFAEHPGISLSQIRFLINFDILGTGEDGIMVVNATQHETEFKQLHLLNAQKSLLKDVKARGKAANSDHYWFAEKGVPAFFIYTLGGIKAYHDILDCRETLPLTEFNDIFQLLLDMNGHFEPR